MAEIERDRETEREDLAAMVMPLGQALVAAELPVLDEHNLSMWAYAILDTLGRRQQVRTQAALARAIGADKTRIIGVLDELQERGLIWRATNPDDRRERLLGLTDEGRRLRDSTKNAIQTAEEQWLARLPDADRQSFLRSLKTLAEQAREHLARS